MDGLYADWQKDDAVASAFCDAAGYPWEDAAPFVLEGGSIHTDGEGTALVTESCLLSAGRNPSLSRQEIEAELCRRLGVRKVLWLPRGIYNDETNEHVDNVCAFVGPAEVVLAWTDDPSDPQYPLSAADLAYLQSVTDAQGRRLKIHKLPIPDHPILCSEADCDAYEFAPGEDTREPGGAAGCQLRQFLFCQRRRPGASVWWRECCQRRPRLRHPAGAVPGPPCDRPACAGYFAGRGETSTASHSRSRCKRRRGTLCLKRPLRPSR